MDGQNDTLMMDEYMDINRGRSGWMDIIDEWMDGWTKRYIDDGRRDGKCREGGMHGYKNG